ncbi:MAG: spermine/spermidine synthase domain-containing protein [Burkholderiales bacterium]
MWKSYILLFIIGISLSIVQFVMIRDFVAVLGGEQIVIVVVTAAFFAALSIGYGLSLHLSRKVFRGLFVASVFLHLSFPFSYRYLAAWLSQMHANGYSYLALLFAYALVFSAVFAVFLPRLIGSDEDNRTHALPQRLRNMRVFYSIELLGFVAGFVCIGLTWNHSLTYLLTLYWVLLGVLLAIVVGKLPVTLAYAATAAVAIVLLPSLDTKSTALLYQYKHWIKDPIVLFSANSPYTKVEVIEGPDKNRHLYLNGLENLNSTDLETLNYYIATVPARLMHPAKTLLVGNGTLSSVPKVYPYSREVVSVELDPGVLVAGTKFFTDSKMLAGLTRWKLVVDDGKHFLHNSRDKYDLIVMDVPSPLTIQVAFLHTVEFYHMAREHLNENGVIAVQLSGKLQRNNRTPARVVAALSQVFREVMVVYSERGDRGFAYASMHLPFSRDDMFAQALSYEYAVQLIEPKDIAPYLARATPLTTNTMDLVIRRGWERINSRYFHD